MDVHSFITQENMEKILEKEFTPHFYRHIIRTLSQKARKYTYNSQQTPLENIKNLASIYADLNPSNDKTNIGYYLYNNIYYDDTQKDSEIITTIIHELSHHLYSEFFTQWLKHIFHKKESTTIDSFVAVMLNNSIENRVADEYLAYKIQSYYTPRQHHNYIAFIQLLTQLNIDVEKSKIYFIYAQSIADDIIGVLDEKITDNLKEDINKQFDKDKLPTYNQELHFDYEEERFTLKEKVEITKEMIIFIFDYYLNGDGNIDEIKKIEKEFDEKMK